MVGCLTQVSLQLQAPVVKGQYRFTAVLTSDSYIGLMIQQELKVSGRCLLCNVSCSRFGSSPSQLNVHEKKEVSGKEQWRELEDEEEEAEVLEESSNEEESESDDVTE